MTLDHIAIWTNNLEKLKEFYIRFFGAVANEKYINSTTQFESYFLSFKSGARIEIMYRPNIPRNENDIINAQHQGLIHLAFGVETMKEVEIKALELTQAGFPILNGPRKTGDGYYEIETLDLDGNRIEITTPFIA